MATRVNILQNVCQNVRMFAERCRTFVRMFHTVPIVPVVHESQHVQAGIWVHLGHLYAFSTVDGNNRGHILCLALIGFH